MFGKFDIDDDLIIINRIRLLAKIFICRCKLGKINPSIDVFKAKLRAQQSGKRSLEITIVKFMRRECFSHII